jgi:hypothetical protein
MSKEPGAVQTEDAMGEMRPLIATGFNTSLRVESRAGRLTGDTGVVVLREIPERNGIDLGMTPQLSGARRQEDVVHDLPSLIRTRGLRAARGRREVRDRERGTAAGHTGTLRGAVRGTPRGVVSPALSAHPAEDALARPKAEARPLHRAGR